MYIYVHSKNYVQNDLKFGTEGVTICFFYPLLKLTQTYFHGNKIVSPYPVINYN
jgi:hypothetical protein